MIVTGLGFVWRKLAYGSYWRTSGTNGVFTSTDTDGFLRWYNDGLRCEITFSTYTVQRMSNNNVEAAMQENVPDLN